MSSLIWENEACTFNKTYNMADGSMIIMPNKEDNDMQHIRHFPRAVKMASPKIWVQTNLHIVWLKKIQYFQFSDS